MDDPWVLAILRKRCANLAPSARVFLLSAAAYRQWWKRAAAAVMGGADKVGPPHSCRHTGASRDLATGYRTFEQVQRRGRWKATDSVQRYARVRARFEAVERQPASIRDEVAAILRTRPPRPAQPRGG